MGKECAPWRVLLPMIAVYIAYAIVPHVVVYTLYFMFDRANLLLPSHQIPLYDIRYENYLLPLSWYLYLFLVFPLDRPWRRLPPHLRGYSRPMVVLRVVLVGFSVFCYGVSMPAVFWPAP